MALLKIILFSFAGSSHSKYTIYLLEAICDLELESSPQLHGAVFRGLVTNLSGKIGSDPGLPLSDNQIMSRDMWQLPFAAAMGSGCMFIVYRAFER
jgi:hypothetical protein